MLVKMRIVTVIVLIIAIVTAMVALRIAIGSSQSPLSSDSSGNSSVVATAVDEKKKLTSIATDSLARGSDPIFATIDDNVYATKDFSEFYSVTGDGITKFDEVKTIKISALISGVVCELELHYVKTDSGVVGGGVYHKTLEQAGVYEVELKLRCTLTEMPSALDGREGEKLLLVGHETDKYYSEAFAIDLGGGYSRNLFSQLGRDADSSTGFVMLTDELVKQSDEYLYFFSTRMYQQSQNGSAINTDESVDLFRTKGGVEELVMPKVHHSYLSFIGSEKLCYIRSDFATLSYTLGSVPAVSYTETGFSVVHLDLVTMTETVQRKYDVSFSATYERFGDYLVNLDSDEYDVLSVYNMVTNESGSYSNAGMRMILTFDVSEDGRYIAVGGSTTTVSELNQCIRLIDTQSGEMVIIRGKGLFLAIDEQFGFIDSDYFINTTFVGSGEDFVFHITDVKEIFKIF